VVGKFHGLLMANAACQAYQAKEVFYEIYETNVGRGAEQRCHQSREKLDHKIHPLFGSLMTAMQNWHDEIFTQFDRPVTNAYTESTNNLIHAIATHGRCLAALREKMLFTEGVQKLETHR
jgi:transposase